MTAFSNSLLSNQGADFCVPDGTLMDRAIRRTTHLGVGAHQDDLEFMAMHGIIECFDSKENWFGGVTCTNGASSARTGPFADKSDEQLQEIRAEEQREAARIGRYGCVAQLDHASATVKDLADDSLETDLHRICEYARPTVVYTHSLTDKHATHIAVASAFIKALRSLPPELRPRKVIGCEVWRDLDWMADEKKVVMDLSSYPELASKLNGLFVSQIGGGKRYDLAVEGRRRANATFFDSHSTDAFQSVAFGMDLTPLITDETLCPKEYVGSLMEEFREDVDRQISRFF